MDAMIDVAPGASESLVVFRLDEQRYALGLAAVERVLPLMAWAVLPEAPAVVLGVINVHGTIVPVVDLRRRLGCAGRRYTLADQLLVARTRRRLLALPVDEVVAVQTVAASDVIPATAVLPALGHLVGVVALADGILFIQDLEAFLSLDEERALGGALEANPG